MKKAIILAIFCLPSIAYAQSTQDLLTPVNLLALCGKTKTVLEMVFKHEEEQVWSGHEKNILVSVWHNKITNSFTVFKTSPDGQHSCVVAVSTGTKVIKD